MPAAEREALARLGQELTMMREWEGGASTYRASSLYIPQQGWIASCLFGLAPKYQCTTCKPGRVAMGICSSYWYQHRVVWEEAL